MFTNEIPKPSTVCSVQARNLTMPNFATGGGGAGFTGGSFTTGWALLRMGAPKEEPLSNFISHNASKFIQERAI